MSIDWNWGIFLQQAPFGNTTYLGWLWSGFQITVALSVTAWIIAFFVGSLFGILRTTPSRLLSTIGTCYVELFRNVPLIVQFFTWYLVVPELLPENFQIIQRSWHIFRKGKEQGKNRVSIKGVTYEGILKVCDEDKFKELLVTGIGRGKAYGMGLLTIVHV